MWTKGIFVSCVKTWTNVDNNPRGLIKFAGTYAIMLQTKLTKTVAGQRGRGQEKSLVKMGLKCCKLADTASQCLRRLLFTDELTSSKSSTSKYKPISGEVFIGV